MILIDNINYLRENFPKAREILKKVEEREEKDFFIEETRKGDKTLYYIKNDKKTYFHSKYNPIREAQAIIDEYKDVKDSNIIFYGTGLGYHIDLFVKNNPDNNFYIFEPIPEMMEKFLAVRNLKEKQYRNLKGISIGLDDIAVEIDEFLDLNRKDTIIIELPIHKQSFEKEFKKFYEIFLDTIKEKRTGIIVNYRYQKRWIINSMKNFKEVLRTPNILLEKKGEFKDKPAVLVAAGPSLNEEIENIRYIKENRLAYIFSVGSAINTLIYHNIYPDAVTTYDPMETTNDNHLVFEKIIEKKITQIPMIFGSSVGHRTQSEYPGEKCHMITSQDKIAHYYLKSNEDEEMDMVLDSASIALITLQLLSKLGFNPIILAGQNLGYLDNVKYAKGIDYENDVKIEDAIEIEDVNGNQILTNDGYNRMRQQMELYISEMEKGRVINTTKNGAKIKGAEFIELSSIIKDKLKEKVVDDNWIKTYEKRYSKENLKFKLENMENALEESYRFINDYNSILDKMFLLVKNRNFRQLEIMYRKLDISIISLESNIFFTTFILKINRVQHKLLSDAVKISRLEKDIYKRNIDLLNAYKEFIEKCSKDMELIKPIYNDMRNDILEYVEREDKDV